MVYWWSEARPLRVSLGVGTIDMRKFAKPKKASQPPHLVWCTRCLTNLLPFQPDVLHHFRVEHGLIPTDEEIAEVLRPRRSVWCTRCMTSLVRSQRDILHHFRVEHRLIPTDEEIAEVLRPLRSVWCNRCLTNLLPFQRDILRHFRVEHRLIPTDEEIQQVLQNTTVPTAKIDEAWERDSFSGRSISVYTVSGGAPGLGKRSAGRSRRWR
jgi:hypothetical protein